MSPRTPPVYEGVSVFLAYLGPVHYDDITPSPVKPLMLGELLSGELNKRMRTKQRSSNNGSTATPPPPPVPPVQPVSRTSGAMPVKVRTASSENLVKSYLESSGASSVTAPLVPRSRPQSNSAKESHHQLQDPPRPPPTPPTSFRTHGDYTY